MSTTPIFCSGDKTPDSSRIPGVSLFPPIATSSIVSNQSNTVSNEELISLGRRLSSVENTQNSNTYNVLGLEKNADASNYDVIKQFLDRLLSVDVGSSAILNVQCYGDRKTKKLIFKVSLCCSLYERVKVAISGKQSPLMKYNEKHGTRICVNRQLTGSQQSIMKRSRMAQRALKSIVGKDANGKEIYVSMSSDNFKLRIRSKGNAWKTVDELCLLYPDLADKMTVLSGIQSGSIPTINSSDPISAIHIRHKRLGTNIESTSEPVAKMGRDISNVD